ncbi:helix-turn-helix transcriptional regulator [Amnibacterium setariae]|uniref:XRE family transcriptional regulator n=1 Tax=Amnibacterium setariae TaxID=2306585 RepID=A0A3A1TXS5_9MICO|nr:helix-turn-helix transcriptional regulator [Amnibacterium setariae]RIX28408.1 XRE family transcriptional regulator [Amnibacterium setariae]
MDTRVEIREFLTSRRARLTPQAAGLPAFGGNRRVQGLRREEVAMLAGVSVDYYTQLERGRLTGVSDTVIEALVRALRLDEAEREHLFDLARAANDSPVAPHARRTAEAVRPTIQRMLDAITEAPAWVRNERFDLLAGNALGRALYSPVFTMPGRVNTARFAFLDPAAKTFFRDWEHTADDTVATLHGVAGRNPYDKRLTDLIGELSTRSEAFRRRWAAHDVRFHRTGLKRLHHPVVGDLDLTFEALELPADPGLLMLVYGAEPGTPSSDGLRLLATLQATERAAATADD